MSYNYESPKKSRRESGIMTGASAASQEIHKYFSSPDRSPRKVIQKSRRSPGFSPEKIKRALSPKQKRSPEHVGNSVHTRHPEYHFFSPKHDQHLHHTRDSHRNGKKTHRRALSLEKRDECYAFMNYVQYLNVEVGTRTLLPPQTESKPTLVLDLDETLVHCSTMEMENAHFNFTADFHGKLYNISGKKRPGLTAFLAHVSQLWEVVVFTASTSVYADQVVDIIDPRGQYISKRLFRESCTNVEGNYIKDLASLNRDLKQTIIVDNSPQVFALQVTNGIPIQSWYEDDSDQELSTLTTILDEVLQEDDMRRYIHYEFQIPELLYTLE